MFDKLKKLRELQELKNSLKEEKFEVQKEGIRVIINGNLEVEEINMGLGSANQEMILKDCFNEAVKKAQMAMAQKFQGMM